MKHIGLTGGIGMGKSTVADLLKARGYPVIDTDVLARQVVEPGEPALAEIQQTFGADLVGADGRLRRDELARRVFCDDRQRRRLEAILHPRIRELWLAQAKAWESQGQKTCVVVIPLLFETNAEAHFDLVICVACSPATQRERLLARGWKEAEMQERLQAQWPVEKKMALADFVVWNEAGLDEVATQLDRVCARIDELPKAG